MSQGCPFAGIGFSLFAAFASFSALFPKFLRKAIKESLPRGVERDAEGKLWFRELSEFWPGQAMSLEIAKILHAGHTGLQEVLVFESVSFGRVLVLDGAIQLATVDECAYQEVMAHTPMHVRKAATRALVIGGGDGGVLRELAKYPELEEIHICEIDGGVIELAKRFFPQTAVGFEDPRVQVHVEDGFLFLERMVATGEKFDVIVSDLSDPIGPAESVFNGSFLELVNEVLAADGVAALQGECFWLHADLIRKLMGGAERVFPHVAYASIAIPTYPCGQIGCLVMSKGAAPHTVVRAEGIDYQSLSYYTRELHAAQFVLPKLTQRILARNE